MMTELEICIATYIINLKKRPERLQHVLGQFQGREEFNVHIIEAIEHPVGNFGLWQSIKKAILLAKESGEDVALICEDDHHFTSSYSESYLVSSIVNGAKVGLDILSGGVGGLGRIFPAAPYLLWVDWFWCTQFIVVYSKFYDTILESEFSEKDTVDGKLSALTGLKAVTYPFMSVQKDMGYSDVTNNNNVNRGLINRHFEEAASRIGSLLESQFTAMNNYVHYANIHRDSDAEVIVPLVYDLVKPKSIVDFGCGPGHFLNSFLKNGAKEILGLDGNFDDNQQRLLGEENFQIRNFELPICLSKRYDMAICLEVAEHLHPESADTLVKSLTNASDTILFSAAVPGQGGQHHINEQWVDYWVEKFAKHGFSFYDPIRAKIWNHPDVHWWYKQNIFLVVSDKIHHNFIKQHILSYIHPDHYKEKVGI
ncbi:methyltransferase domain-containing protein [Chitinophaga sp. RAB17]|uniref:methyltransferase domain-containing protein n=1 Tax=Chitinophaga sp. RAB17 TaxID=3233049 RepID=UPI003F921BA2